jgi:hypothetical protein
MHVGPPPLREIFHSGDPCEFTYTPHATYTPSHSAMAPSRELSQERCCENDFTGTVRIPDYYADALQAWFRSINATFAVSRVMKPLTEFHWALSKLQATLVDTIGPLCHNLSIVNDPYDELQRTLLGSYGLSEQQRIIKWLDHPGLGANKPSVLMDQLNALKPTSVKEIQKVLFLRKMPTHTRDIVNLRDFTDLPTLTERCYKIGRTEARILALPQRRSCGSTAAGPLNSVDPPSRCTGVRKSNVFPTSKKHTQQFLFLVRFRCITVHLVACLQRTAHRSAPPMARPSTWRSVCLPSPKSTSSATASPPPVSPLSATMSRSFWIYQLLLTARHYNGSYRYGKLLL